MSNESFYKNRGYYTTIVKVDVFWVKCVMLEQGMSERRWGLLVEFISTVTGIHSILICRHLLQFELGKGDSEQISHDLILIIDTMATLWHFLEHCTREFEEILRIEYSFMQQRCNKRCIFLRDDSE